MQVIKPMALGLTTRPIEFKRRLGLSVCASLYFPFRPAGQGTVWTDMSMWTFLGREMPGGPLIDEGVIKTTPEFLVHGHAQVPGKAVQGCEVIARVGGLEKKLNVFGRRQWLGKQIGPIEPFTSLPLDWQHAYGGPGHPDNPVGMGRPDPAQPDAPRWIPQVLAPNAHPRHPQDEVTPQGMRALDCSWAPRARRAGTYDQAWMQQHMPGFAPDIDWRYFNLAPPDQWFSQPLRGDEAFEFVHLHPTQAQVGGVLPGLRVRCFTEHGQGSELMLREVSMSLSTLWFFPHAERGVMLFHGLAPCEQDDGTDIRLLMGAIERLDEAREPQHYLEAARKRRDPRDGALHSLRQSDLMPTLPLDADPDFEATLADFKPEGLLGQAQRRGARHQAQLALDAAVAAGADAATLPALPALEPEPLPTMEELPDVLMRKRDELLNAEVNAALDMIEQRRAAEAMAKAAGIDPQRLVPRGPPQAQAEAQVAALQAAATAAGRPDAVNAAQILPGLQQMEAMARQHYLMAAHEQPPIDPLPPERLADLRRRVQAAHADGKSFLRADFTGADFSGLDLTGADFTGAWLEGVNFQGAKLAGAGFAFAVLARADLRGADLTEADFTSANLGGSQLEAARFIRATLSGAILHKTALLHTDWRHARIDGLQLHGATYGVADWRGTEGAQLMFNEADLRGMLFTKCQWVQPTFIRCDLSGVDFIAARLTRATFIACKLAGARFAQADLVGASFLEGCDLSGADFTEAQLAQALLRGAHLKAACLARADLQDADLSAADATGLDARGARLDRALLIRTVLQGAQLQGASLMNAIAQRADLRGAHLGGANLHGSDLSRIWRDAATLTPGALSTRAKVLPERTPTA